MFLFSSLEYVRSVNWRGRHRVPLDNTMLPTLFWKSNPPQNSNFSPNQLPKVGYFCLPTPKIRSYQLLYRYVLKLLAPPRSAPPLSIQSLIAALEQHLRQTHFFTLYCESPKSGFRLPVSPLNSKCRYVFNLDIGMIYPD